MPKDLTAAQYFDSAVMRHKFAMDILRLSNADPKTNIAPDFRFEPETKRLFILEQDPQTNEWKRISLAEKFGPNVSNPALIANSLSHICDALYDLVEKGLLFFYNRDSAVPMKYTFHEVKPELTEKERAAQERGEVIDKPSTFTVTLEGAGSDPRFADITPQREIEADGETERYNRLVAEAKEKARVEAVLNSVDSSRSLQTLNVARQRAHGLLSLSNPTELTFGANGRYTAQAVEVPAGSRFNPEEMDLITLAACCTDAAGAENRHPDYAKLPNESRILMTLLANTYEDVMIGGREGSIESAIPMYDKGREIAGELIAQHRQGAPAQLQKVMMTALRRHIQACRDVSILGNSALLLYEKTSQLANLMNHHQLYGKRQEKEFRELKAEADAVGKLAQICMDGMKARKELAELHRSGADFKDEAQRQDIIGRIAAHRYLTALDQKGKNLREKEDPNYLKQQQQQEKIAEDDSLTSEQKSQRFAKLNADGIKKAKRHLEVQTIMDSLRQKHDVANRLKGYGLLTAEGQKLLNTKTPLELLEAVSAVSDTAAKNHDELNQALIEDMQDKMATMMDRSIATSFWGSMRQTLDVREFNPSLLPADFDRLMLMKNTENGPVMVKASEELGLVNTELRGDIALADLGFMGKLHAQIEQGNVFFYKRGAEVPHRLSLAQNGEPVMEREPVEAKRPGRWARFMHAISGGRFYRKEFERYEQETYLRSDAATSARKAAAPTEQEAYQQAQKADQRKKDKHALETNPNKTYADMTAVRSRAHKVLSLDDPQQVTYVNDPTGYTGQPYTIPDRVKNTFTPEQLDALCLAGISSVKAAEAFMKTGDTSHVGTTAESTANLLEGHIYHDILCVGRDNSAIFNPLLDAGRQVAADAMEAYAAGNPQEMAKLLGDSIRSTVFSGRYDTGVKSNSALATDMALRMVSMLETDPALADNCGIDKETLEGYKQELASMRMIGEAYERASEAHTALISAALEDKMLSAEDAKQIATDLMTYEYLNTLQKTGHDKAALENPQIDVLLMYFATKQKPLDANGNPVDPTQPGATATVYHLTDAEHRDLQLEIKNLYTKPFVAVAELFESTMEQIRSHVAASSPFKALENLTDPLELTKALGKCDLKKMTNEVSSSRKYEVIENEKALLERLKEQAAQLNGGNRELDNRPVNVQEGPQQQMNQGIANTM